MRAAVRLCFASAAFSAALALPVSAADLPNWPATDPSLAQAALGPPPDPWAGLYAGAGVSAWGGKGVKGGFGGDGYLGYDHAFDNGVVLGVRASSGYEPFLWSTPRGFTQFTGTAFAGGEAVVSYRMGQLTPYVIVGLDLARPTQFGTTSPLDAINTVFSGPGAVQAVGTVGMGVTYQVSPNFSMGLEARVHTVTNGAAASAWPY